jgi:hypothetical protein
MLNRILVGFILLLAMLSTSCGPLDYRSKFEGSYQLHLTVQGWMANSTSSSETVDAIGTVYHVRGKGARKIHVQVDSNHGYVFKVDHSGNLSNCGGSGTISETEVNFTISSKECDPSALGGGNTVYCTGHKVN